MTKMVMIRRGPMDTTAAVALHSPQDPPWSRPGRGPTRGFGDRPGQARRAPAGAPRPAWSPWPSSSSARWPPSRSAPSSSSAGARTPPSCCTSPPRPSSPGRHPLPRPPRRHRAQLPRGPRLPGRAGRGRGCPPPRRPGAGLHRRGPGRRPRAGGVAQPPPDHDPARRHQRQRVRRRLRRRPAGRGQGAGQGACPVVPRLLRPVGPQAPAPRAVAALPGQRAPGRAPARLPALGLDGARHLAVHPP